MSITDTSVLLSAATLTPLTTDDSTRLPRLLQPNDHDRPRASSEDNRSRSDDYIYNDESPVIDFDNSPPREEAAKLHKPSSVTILLSPEETINLFQTTINKARQERDDALGGSEEVSEAVRKLTLDLLTVDLGRANIARVPESVVDIIKEDVYRLSLSHNQIWYIPLRFSECTQLRYLNIRSNVFREIPRGVYKLAQLEILDLSRNKIRKISKEVKNLSSLKVLSITHNRIDDLPSEICEMTNLQVLKVSENPLRFKLKKIVEAKENELALSEKTENERGAEVTKEIKKYLRELFPISAPPLDIESGGEASEGPLETSRPFKWVPSSRFPVKPSTGSGDSTGDTAYRSPNGGRPPPIPTRSHNRMVSGQSISLPRRPSITPLLVGNERNRSNSESVLQASAAARSKRMGILKKERLEMDTVDERPANRYSHLRGLSYGSVLRPRTGSIASSGGNSSTSPGSPKDARKNRIGFVKRLSSLPEHKKESNWRNPVVDGAKGILYSLYQIHPQISGLISAIKGKESRRSSLELTFYNASSHVDRLNEALEQAESVDIEDEEAIEKTEATLQRDCATCIMAYTHVTSQLQDSVPKIVANTDGRYLRTLLLLVYGTVVEIKNAITSFGLLVEHSEPPTNNGVARKIEPLPEESSSLQQAQRGATPTRERRLAIRPTPRLRSDTAIQHPNLEDFTMLPPNPPFAQQAQQAQQAQALHLQGAVHLTGNMLHGGTNNSSISSITNGSTLNSSMKPSLGMRSRSSSRNTSNFTQTNSSIASSMVNTPRSGEVFSLPPPTAFSSRINPATGLTDSQEEAAFEKIFLALTKAYDSALQAIPVAQQRFERCLEAAEESRYPKEVRDLWTNLVRRCKSCHEVSEALQIRLVNMRLKDPASSINGVGIGRNDPSFWMLCKTFMQSFVELVTVMREAKDLRLLPQETVKILQPVQKASRSAGQLIETSPWRSLADAGAIGATQLPSAYSNNNTTYANQSAMYTSGTGGYGVGNNHGHGATTGFAASAQAHHFHQSPFPPPIIPIPPIPAGANSTSPGSIPLPATPLSAALGPAAQATIPSTPVASGYGDHFFSGNVFERADSLLKMPQAGNMNFLNRR